LALINLSMDQNIQLGIQLLMVGMLSVFIILGIVVSLGKLLILTVNKYSKEPQKQKRHQNNRINRNHLVALSAVVETVTQGQGVIKSITKVKDQRNG